MSKKKCNKIVTDSDECKCGSDEHQYSIISDEAIDFISINVRRHKISDKYKGTKLFLK